MGCDCKKERLRNMKISGKKTIVLTFGWDLGEGCKEHILSVFERYKGIRDVFFRKNKASFRVADDFNLPALKEDLRNNLFDVE